MSEPWLLEQVKVAEAERDRYKLAIDAACCFLVAGSTRTDADARADALRVLVGADRPMTDDDDERTVPLSEYNDLYRAWAEADHGLGEIMAFCDRYPGVYTMERVKGIAEKAVELGRVGPDAA